MPSQLVCPDLELYQELASGRLPVGEKESLLLHLESCEACAQKLGTLSPHETLVELLRQAKTDGDGKPGEEVTRLVDRLSKLNPLETQTRELLTFRCSECGQNLKVKQSVAGKKVKCPNCRKQVRAPGVEAATCTIAAEASKQPERSDGPTLAPSAPVSLTDPGSFAENRPAPNAGDTIGQDANENPELTEFLAPAQAPDELGRLGPYRVLAILGAGGMGVVYKAEDPQLKRLVALKAMLPSLGASSSARKRFLREAQSAAAIKHDHIVSIYQVGEERGVPYLAMEFLHGEPLDERLKRDKNLPLKEILRIGREMAEGLSAAHEAGLIHRDIKPANVWLEGKKARVKILDFGLARAAAEEQHLTQSGAIIGTPAYMAPEQAQGKPVDRRCDLFSLGVVLYRLCTSQMPFQGTDTVSTLMAVSTHEPPTPAKLNAQVPAALSDLVMQLLAKDPAERVGSAEEVVEVLTALQAQLDSGAIAEPKPARSVPRTPAPASLDKTNPDTVTREAAPKTKTLPVAAPPRSRRNVFMIAAVAVAFGAFCALLGGGAIAYRLFFQDRNGTLVVNVEGDADVRFKKGKVEIRDKQGNLLYTLMPSERNKSLPFGDYTIDVVGSDGLTLSTREFKMTKDGWTVQVRLADMARLALPTEKKPPPPGDPGVAEKGVLDYAEIHDADEKAFDAWLGRQKTDGYCPVSLSVQTVQDAPRFTAVAIKEEKNKFWEVSRVLTTDDKHLDVMWAKEYVARADCLYRTKGELREAMLWIWDPNAGKGSVWSGNRTFMVAKLDEARANKGMPTHFSALVSDMGTNFTVIMAPEGTRPWAETANQSLDECKAHMAKQKAEGWRPEHLYVYGKGPKTLFGTIMIQDAKGPAWDVSWALTPAQYEAELAARKAKGFRPHTAAAHDQEDGSRRFSVIWIYYRSTGSEAPVMPQAERGVEDFAEIHHADEKRFDAWIAQMQKDGFKPVSLTCQVVKDGPRFTAVAVKEAKKHLWEYTRAEYGMEGADIDRMNGKNYSAYLQCPQTYKGKYWCSVLWQWNFPRTWIWTGDKLFIGNKTAEAREANFRALHRSADDQGRGLVYSVIFGPDDGVPMKDAFDLSSDECRALIAKHKPDGWMPTNLYAYGAAAKLLFGVTLRQEKECPAWDLSWSLTPAQYEAELIERKKQGFRPHSSVGFEDDDGAQRYSAIWIRYRSAGAAPLPQAAPIAERGVHDYAEIHDADEKRFDAWIAQMKKEGLRPTRLTVQTVKDAPRYTAVALKDDKNWPWEFSRHDESEQGIAAKRWKRKFEAIAHAMFFDKKIKREAFIWAKDDSLDNDGYWVGDAAFIENKIVIAAKEKARLISRSGVLEGNAPYFGVIIEDVDDMLWQEAYDLKFDAWKAYVEKHQADGWRPDHFCYYGQGSKRFFGAILVKDPGKTDWDVSWSLTAADYEKELTERKQRGFRPLTALGHEDSAGGQRFSAIWVRYRDPNAGAAKEVRAPDLATAKVLYRDVFDDPKSGFFNELNADGGAGYVNGKYVVKMAPKAYMSCGNGQYANFACEVTGRMVKPVSGRWGLNIFNPDTKHGLGVTINADGKLVIKPDPADVAKLRGPNIGPLAHAAIKRAEELNTLLVVVRGRQVEVYVNSVQVCEPITMDRDIAPGWSSMALYGGKEGAEVEIARYTVWSADGLPSASAGAAPPEAKKFKVPAAAFKHKIGMEFALIPKGKAWLDGGGGKEGKTPVTFDHDFYLGMYEVTQEQWETVMELKHPFHFSRKGDGKDVIAGITDADLKRFPVENVSWNECQLFLKKLNELDKKPGWEYRLPTEAEWEYACRDGPGDKFHSAFDYYLEEPTNVLLTAQANFEHDKGFKRTCPVGSYPPNKLGLFDMHGNVAELTHNPQPTKDEDGNPHRNERGGGWTNTGGECKATGRHSWSQVDRFRDVGLRVALVPVSKEAVLPKKKK